MPIAMPRLSALASMSASIVSTRLMPGDKLLSKNSFRLSHPAFLILLPLLKQKLDSRTNELDDPNLLPVLTLPASAAVLFLKNSFKQKPSDPMILPRSFYASGPISMSGMLMRLRAMVPIRVLMMSLFLSVPRLPASHRLLASIRLPRLSRCDSLLMSCQPPVLPHLLTFVIRCLRDFSSIRKLDALFVP